MLNCMVINSDGAMCIVIDSRVYSYAKAFSLYQEKASEIASSGVFHEGGIFVGDYYCEDNFIPAKVYIGYDYPVDTVVKDAENIFTQYAATYTYKGFGIFDVKYYIESLMNELKIWAKDKRPVWEFRDIVKEEPKVVVEKPEIVETSAEGDAVKDSNNEVIQEESTVDELKTDQSEIDLSSLVPLSCRGETWATTEHEVFIHDYACDVDCIEDNWEQRGDYYILDCLPRNKRLIVSEKKNYYNEFTLGNWATTPYGEEG